MSLELNANDFVISRKCSSVDNYNVCIDVNELNVCHITHTVEKQCCVLNCCVIANSS